MRFLFFLLCLLQLHTGKGLASSADTIIKNRKAGGTVSVKPDNVSGTEVDLLSADPESQSVTVPEIHTDTVVGDTGSAVNIKGTILSGGELSGGPSINYTHINTNHYIRKIRDDGTTKIYHLWISKKQDTSSLTLMTTGPCDTDNSRYMTFHYRIVSQRQDILGTGATQDGYWRGIIRKTCSNSNWSGTTSLINYVAAGSDNQYNGRPLITNDNAGLSIRYNTGRSLLIEMHIIIVGATDQDTFYAGIF